MKPKNNKVKTKRKTRIKKEWSVYIVRCADSTLYTGIAKNVKHRVGMHNSGKGAKYIVEERRPVELCFVEEGYDCGEALKREVKIKRLGKIKKEKLVETGLPTPPERLRRPGCPVLGGANARHPCFDRPFDKLRAGLSTGRGVSLRKPDIKKRSISEG